MIRVTIEGKIFPTDPSPVTRVLGLVRDNFFEKVKPRFGSDVDEVHYVRGKERVFIDRGNRGVDFEPFAYIWEFATEAMAQAFLTDVDRSTPRVGTVLFELAGGGRRKLENARVLMTLELDGVSVLATYQISGGIIMPA